MIAQIESLLIGLQVDKMDPVNHETIFTHLKVFVQFICEEKVHSIEEMIDASIVLLKHCPSSRQAVFKFYSKLFTEYCYEYCVTNGNNSGANIEKQELVILQRFLQALHSTQAKNIKKSLDENTDKAEIKSIEDCPQSPSREVTDDYPMEDISLGGISQKDIDLSVIISILDRQFSKVEDILTFLQENHSDLNFTVSISDWILDLVSEISKNFSSFVINDSNSSLPKNQGTSKLDNLSLMSALGFWVQCPAMQVLTGVVLKSASINKTEAKALSDRLLKYSPHSDWLLAHLCTNISQSLNLTDYIEQLINQDESSYSTTFILSYVSEHNPQAIVNCSKSNLPLLLKLCTNSKPLLDLLAHDIVKKVNVNILNNLAESHTSDEITNHIIYCILNAPNAFELLKLSFDLVVHQQASETLSSRIINILSLVTMQIHKYVHEASNCSDNAFPIISLLRNNIQQLISHQSIAKNTSLKKLQLKLLKLICIRYGCEFITEVFHHLLNVSTCSIGTSNYDNIKLNPLLSPLYNSLRLHFGHTIQDCIKDTLKLHYNKKLVFWAFLTSFLEANAAPLDCDDLEKYLSQISCDKSENLFRKYYILRILTKIFEGNPELYFRQQYKLCIALVNAFFELMQEMHSCSNQYLVLAMNSIVFSQRLLSNLSSNFNLNEYIVTRHIMDFIQGNSDLFISEYSVSNVSSYINYECKNLLNENLLKVNNNLKCKKNRLLPYHKANRKKQHIENKSVSLNRQLLIDLLQGCIKDKMSFARNFVYSLSNELLMNDAPWMDEDPKEGQVQQLRMTLEKDLSIARLFEEKPILWNVFEIISNGQYLQHCAVVIRALLNVQRANLASSTYRDQNILLTQRIITLMANDEILPKKPFIYIPEIVPKIKNWEMAYVLQDISKYIRDCNNNSAAKLNLKPYLDRLRIIMTLQPSEIFIKIFKYL